MSDNTEYILTDEVEDLKAYARYALEGIVIAAVITGNQSFQEPKNIAGAAFEIAHAMVAKEKEYAAPQRTQ